MISFIDDSDARGLACSRLTERERMQSRFMVGSYRLLTQHFLWVTKKYIKLFYLFSFLIVFYTQTGIYMYVYFWRTIYLIRLNLIRASSQIKPH